MLTRLLTSLALVLYLVVGCLSVRVFSPEMTTITLNTSVLSLFSKTELSAEKMEILETPEIAFNEIKFPVEPKVVVKPAKIAAAKPVNTTIQMVYTKLSPNELPFYEPVKLSPVVMEEALQTNLLALYKDFSYEVVAEVKDEVQERLAAVETEAEPEFFEYSEPVVAAAPAKEATALAPETAAEVSTNESTESTDSNIVHTASENQNVDNSSEVVSIDDLLVFDYSKAEKEIKEQTMPVVGVVTTQNANPSKIVEKFTVEESKPVKKQKSAPTEKMTTQNEAVEKNALSVDKSYAMNVTIQAFGTNLVKAFPEVGFEVRFQDDLGEALQDYGTGAVTINETLAQPRMTRSISLLKRGYAPTNTDLIMDEETTGVSIPLVEEEKFNELMAPYEVRGVIGAALVELDDSTENAKLDVPVSEVLKLDGDLLVTEGEDFRYLLFLGVKAGNALLSYEDNQGKTTSRIIHIHEREVTFDANYFENVTSENVKLVEEDLLTKEKTPLVIASSSVKEFATNKTANKINNHTYKTSFGKVLLGSRKYLELSHQSEPLFVGFREQSTLEIPSENFMRFILSKFADSNLGNRCLVQVNLNKEALKVDVAGESVGQGLVTYTQVLDADGKFYDSVGPKSRRVIIMGENQGSPDYAMDSKINVKVSYQDGTVQYLGTYCSPNTYLVEQL